jgi:hypothetical protein
MKFMWRLASIHAENVGFFTAFGFQTPPNRDAGLVRQGATGREAQQFADGSEIRANSNLIAHNVSGQSVRRRALCIVRAKSAGFEGLFIRG